MIFGISMLIPAMVATYNSVASINFWVPAICSIGFGGVFWHYGKNHDHEFKTRHASLMVIIIWFFLPLIGAIPLISYTSSNSLVDAYFEAVSGLTASGATILFNIDILPVSIKLWRGLLSWLGGMGLIVLAVAILPSIGVGGRQLMKSEITGPIKDQDLTPQINETAKGLWVIYAGLTIVCMAMYFIAGMNPLDAIVHSFTTLALGGFSNHDNSFAYFNSPLIEAIAIFFMIVAGFNFATHIVFFQKIKSRATKLELDDLNDGSLFYLFKNKCKKIFSPYRYDAEFFPYLLVIFISLFIVLLVLFLTSDMQTTQIIRTGVFNTVSIITTTGYSNTDFYLAWPLFLSVFILLVASFCSCSGSTGGGIKMIRALIIFNRTRVEQTKTLHPYAHSQVKIRGRLVPDQIVISVLFFAVTYLLTIFLITFLLLAAQPSLDLTTAFSASMASVSNTGPGLGDVGPGSNYSSLNAIATSICSLAMLLGRLEFLLFLLIFSKRLWK